MKKILFAGLILIMIATVCLSETAFSENLTEVDRTERNIACLGVGSVQD